MKTIFFAILLAPLFLSAAPVQLNKIELQAAGLTCSMCSKAIYQQLHTLDFIDSISVNIEKETFQLYLKSGMDIDFNQIKKKVEDAGFSVASLKADYIFTQIKPDEHAVFNYQDKAFYFLPPAPPILNGELPVQIIDKGFIGAKEYKKYAGRINTGATGKNIFHVIPVVL